MDSVPVLNGVSIGFPSVQTDIIAGNMVLQEILAWWGPACCMVRRRCSWGRLLLDWLSDLDLTQVYWWQCDMAVTSCHV